MKHLNICIDIDGTITDPYYWLNYCNKYFNKNVTTDQVKVYAMHTVMGVTENEIDEFYEKYKYVMHSLQEMRIAAKEIINLLGLYHNIYFVTARDKSLTDTSAEYLRKHKIKYDDLFVLGTHHKVQKAQELNCHIFIEDSYENAIELSEAGFKVLLLDTNYNRKPLNSNITRVYDWIEIFTAINKILLDKAAI